MKASVGIALLVLVVVSLSSCVNYQYLTLASDTPQNKAREFIVENDTVLIKYRFDGLSGPVQIYAYNKLTCPLYVDWAKSAIIIGDHSQSYVTGTATLKGNYNGNSYGVTNNRTPYGNFASSYGRISGVIQSETDLSFIPPKTYIEEHRLPIKTDFLTIDPSHKHRVNMPTAIGTASVKFANFDQGSSPLKFRSFLTLSAYEDLSHPFHFENSFWTSEVMETITTPGELGTQHSDRFYNRKSTGVGETFSILGLLILVGVAAANSPHR